MVNVIAAIEEKLQAQKDEIFFKDVQIKDLKNKLADTEKDIENLKQTKKGAQQLPCKVGQKAAVLALCECVYTSPNNDECRYECPFEDDCEFEECDNSNEKIFETKISSIYDNGFGWVVTFENLCIEANIKDLGTSFFIGENAVQQAEEYDKALRGVTI